MAITRVHTITADDGKTLKIEEPLGSFQDVTVTIFDQGMNVEAEIKIDSDSWERARF